MARESVFDRRRMEDPQSVIDDLLGQTTRQATAIHELAKRVAELENILTIEGVDPNVPAKTRKTRRSGT